MDSYPSNLIRDWTSKDGTQITIRPIRPEDREIEKYETLKSIKNYDDLKALFVKSEPTHCQKLSKSRFKDSF